MKKKDIGKIAVVAAIGAGVGAFLNSEKGKKVRKDVKKKIDNIDKKEIEGKIKDIKNDPKVDKVVKSVKEKIVK